MATLRLLEEVSNLFYQHYDYRISPEKIERLIRVGRRRGPVSKQNVMIDELLHKASEKIGPRVMNNLQVSMQAKQNDITTVILAGGGARYY